MFKVIVALIVVAIALLLNHYYLASSLELLSNGIKFKVKNSEYILPYQTRTNESFLASVVNVKRSKLINDQEQFYIEIANIESLYEFAKTPEQIACTLLECKDSRIVFSINGLQAIELIDEEGRVVNLFALQHESKSLVLLYGLSNQTFAQIIKHLSRKEIKSQGNSYRLSKPLTNWSIKHLGIDGVIGSIDH